MYHSCSVFLTCCMISRASALLTILPFLKILSHLNERPANVFKWHKKGENAANTVAEYFNRKHYFMWLALHYSKLSCVQEASVTHWSSVEKRLFSCELVKSHIKKLITKWHRVPLPAAFFTNIVRIAKRTEDKTVSCLTFLSSPSFGTR